MPQYRQATSRFLATVLFTDIVGSTEHAARVGDRVWRDLVEKHHAIVRRELTGLSAGTFVISKATPTATLAVNNSPQAYTGAGQSATVAISVSSVTGTVANVLTGGSATQTTAGTYAVTADFVPTDTSNYHTLTGLSAGIFVISKATPTATLAVTNSPQTYTGAGQSATVTISASSVAGSVANVLTGGSATQTTAGTYAVTADFVPTDISNYHTLTGLSAGTFVISKATPTATLAVSNSPQAYTAAGQSATVAISVSSVTGTVANVLTGGSATETTAGTYAVTADFVPTDISNYHTLTGLTAGTFVISKATPTATLAVNNSPQAYTGAGQSATVAISVSSVTGTVANVLIGGSATQATAGTYAVTANFVPTDATNYHTLTSLSAGTFVISKATPTATLAVNNSPQAYTGAGQSATVAISVSSVTGTVASVLTGGSATQTTAGTYAVTADFVPTDTSNYHTLTGLSAGIFVISKATPTATLAVTNSPQTYTGAGQSATVTISASSVAGSVANVLTGGSATQTTAGTYAVTADFFPTDSANYNSLTGLSAGNFVISQATISLAITGDTPDPSNSAQSVAVNWSHSVATGAGTPIGNVTVTVSGGSETCSAAIAAGTCNIVLTATGARMLTAAYAGSTNFAGTSDIEPHQVNATGYTLNGFHQPVDMNGVFNNVKGGSTVPLKFEVFQGSAEITSTSVVQTFYYGLVGCNASAPNDDIEITTSGGTALRYDTTSGQFIQNWKTPPQAGCYSVTLTLTNGQSLTAYFNIKK